MLRALVLGLVVSLAVPVSARALEVVAAVIRVDEDRLLPLSRLDLPPDGLGFDGGALATRDNQTTGSFLGTEYKLRTVAAAPERAMSEFQRLLDAGIGIFVVMADAGTLNAMADRAGRDVLVLNALAPDNVLRNEGCRANVLHVAPSRAMLSDALAQYLLWKRWEEWVLVEGSHPEDRALAESYRRSAMKFGARIVEERVYEDTGGSRVSDSGHVLVQRQMPVFTQEMEGHDVIVAADEADVFAEYLPYHTWGPDLVTGSAGLEPVSWMPAHEGWGATQFQTRFEELAGRYARQEDYQVWLALRIVGEAVTRTNAADPAAIRDFVLGDQFELAAFKGQAVTFRPWNGQLRQPILLTNGRMPVSVSPQEGFLHQRSPLDSLGFDEPETGCNAFTREEE